MDIQLSRNSCCSYTMRGTPTAFAMISRIICWGKVGCHMGGLWKSAGCRGPLPAARANLSG
jgi:hypothetical protein